MGVARAGVRARDRDGGDGRRDICEQQRISLGRRASRGSVGRLDRTVGARRHAAARDARRGPADSGRYDGRRSKTVGDRAGVERVGGGQSRRDRPAGGGIAADHFAGRECAVAHLDRTSETARRVGYPFGEHCRYRDQPFAARVRPGGSWTSVVRRRWIRGERCPVARCCVLR